MPQADLNNDTATATFVGIPAVIPLRERKNRRVSFADTDDIR
jgi:hypothetical protein